MNGCGIDTKSKAFLNYKCRLKPLIDHFFRKFNISKRNMTLMKFELIPFKFSV